MTAVVQPSVLHIPPYHAWVEEILARTDPKRLWAGLLAVEWLWVLPPDQQTELQDQISERLRLALREEHGEICFRMQHFDFLFIVENPSPTEEWSAQCAQKVVDCFAEPFEVGHANHHIMPYVGLSSGQCEDFSIRNWIMHTQLAMQTAREQQSGFHLYSAQEKQRKSEQYHLQSDLQNAIQHNGFALHYQPKVNLQSGVCVGAEALARWERPLVGAVPPNVFIPVLESSKLIVNFGKTVLNNICQQINAWKEQQLPTVRISFNVSAIQLNTGSVEALFEKTLRDILSQHPDVLLDMELTEGVLMNDVERSMDVLNNLKSLGTTCSIDDFGKGFSSLSYLKNLPVDCLKIDKLFIDDVCACPQTEAIVSAIIFMAHQLNLIVVAEGVETKQQYDKLREMGCDQAQGYYIAKPMPGAAFSQWLVEHFQQHRAVGYS